MLTKKFGSTLFGFVWTEEIGQDRLIGFVKTSLDVLSGLTRLRRFVKYAPKYGQTRYLRHVFLHDKYGQVGCPWKDLQNIG